MIDSPPFTGRKRVRLAPAVRKRLILDAALAEFAANGFGATSTDKIAQRAGLSQAGLYAHFESKDAILVALFEELLEPEWELWMDEGETVSGPAIDAWIDRSYAKLDDPVIQSVFRILIAEGKRVRHLAGQWRRNVVDPRRAEQKRVADTLVAQGKVRRCTLAENTELTLSPLLHALVLQLIHGGEDGPNGEIAVIREAHRRMLKEQLFGEVPPQSGPGPAHGG